MARFIFKSYVLLVFATIFHKSEIRDVETTETDELIEDIELTNQMMMNLIRMNTIVTNLMTAITINQILTLISKMKQRQIEWQSTHKMPLMQMRH